MTIAKETAIAVPALAVLLFVSHVFLGPDESYREFTTTIPTSWLGVAIPDVRFIAKDLITGRASGIDGDADVESEQRQSGELTPRARIRGVFAQFLPNGRRGA